MIIRGNTQGAFNQSLSLRGGEKTEGGGIQEVDGKLAINRQVKESLINPNAKNALLTDAASVSISEEGKARNQRDLLRANKSFDANAIGKTDALDKVDAAYQEIQAKNQIKEELLSDYAKNVAGRTLTEEEQRVYDAAVSAVEIEYDTYGDTLKLDALASTDGYRQELRAKIERDASRDLEIGKTLEGEAAEAEDKAAKSDQTQEILAQYEENESIEGILAQLEGQDAEDQKKTDETDQSSPEETPTEEIKDTEEKKETEETLEDAGQAEPEDEQNQSDQASEARD